MLLALIVNSIGFLQILTQTFYTLHKQHVKGNLLEALLVRWILLIIIILLDNVCLGVFDILPFGTYVYNYYKLMIFVSKSDFHVSMMQKFIVKADPDVLGEFFLTMLSRFMIRIMHKSCMILKRLNLPVSQQDFNLSQEIMEFLEEYHPRIVRTSTNLNNTSFLDKSMVDSQTDAEREQQKKKEEEKRKRMLEKQKKEKMIEEEIQKQQEQLLKIKQQKLQEIENQFDISDQSDNEQKEDQKNIQNGLIKTANSREQSKERLKSPLKSVESNITKIQKPILQDLNKISTQKDEQADYYNPIKRKQQNEAQNENQADNDDDDIINQLDFNDSSSKQEDSSSNEKVYPIQDTKVKQDKILQGYQDEDEYEVLQQQDQQSNLKNGDLIQKKQIKGITKSSSKQQGLPPSNYKSSQEQNSKLKVNSVSGFGESEATLLTQSVRTSSIKKDNKEGELKSYYQKLNQDKATPSYKSKYANNPALYATLSQTRSHLDETKTKFELYKQKYAGNTKFNQNTSLIDKDD
ncbi:hypothetical protein ABPG74_003511 [Tetrahymena malaccensis]